MLPAISRTSNTLLIGPRADYNGILGCPRVHKHAVNNIKPTGHLIGAILYIGWHGSLQCETSQDGSFYNDEIR